MKDTGILIGVFRRLKVRLRREANKGRLTRKRSTEHIRE